MAGTRARRRCARPTHPRPFLAQRDERGEARLIRPARRTGFTILEILIALVVLGVSVMGVLALLVTSTKVASEVVEDTFAATLARSIFESARIAARERSFSVNVTGGGGAPRVVRGFVLTERGMSNAVPFPGDPLTAAPSAFLPPPLPTSPDDVAKLDGPTGLRSSDMTIFLPTDPPGMTGANSSFVFPRPNTAATDNAGLGANNVRVDGAVEKHGNLIPYLVTRTYQLAHHKDAPLLTGAAAQALPKEAADQYSFVIITRQARVPKLITIVPQTAPEPPKAEPYADWQSQDFVPNTVDAPANSTELSDGLYYLEVQVFRNFAPQPDPLVPEPNHMPLAKGRFVGLLAVGP